MSGTVLIRSDLIEDARGPLDVSKWSGDHFIGQIPKPEDLPEGTVCRTKDLKRPDRNKRRERAWIARR
eukprot:375776-Lingulodinium_polyedra.AAC.1